MRRFLSIVVVVLAFLALAGCSGSASSDANQNTNLSSGPVPQYSDASVALAEGTKYLDTGETDKAIDALDQAVKLDPNLAEAWFKLGIAFSLAELREETSETTSPEEPPGEKREKPNSQKAFERAVSAYKKLIEINADDDVAHFNLGRAYNKLNYDEDAAKALKQAVKLKPDDTDYQTELGAILIKLAQYQEAIPPLKKALELDPENIRAQELLEDAEAGRKRVSYSSTPKDDKKPANSNVNANTNSVTPPDGKIPSPTPAVKPSPRPTASRPGN